MNDYPTCSGYETPSAAEKVINPCNIPDSCILHPGLRVMERYVELGTDGMWGSLYIWESSCALLTPAVHLVLLKSSTEIPLLADRSWVTWVWLKHLSSEGTSLSFDCWWKPFMDDAIYHLVWEWGTTLSCYGIETKGNRTFSAKHQNIVTNFVHLKKDWCKFFSWLRKFWKMCCQGQFPNVLLTLKSQMAESLGKVRNSGWILHICIVLRVI